MAENLREKFQKEIDQADWDLLGKHNERGALFVVSDELNLVDICVAVAEDNSELIASYLTSKKLAKPTDAQVTDWDENKFTKMADFIIVQPYVFIKLLRNLQ